MSVHSAMSPGNHNFGNSHHNNPSPSMEAHSVLVEGPSINPEHQQWVAAYIDGQYFLTDPQSMRRLRDIETEIEKERSKLENLQNGNSLSNSFLSFQEDRNQRFSNKSFCNTEFNENLHITKKELVKNELQKEEDKYRDKIRIMQKEKNDMKKIMKPASQQHSQVKKGEPAKVQQNLDRRSEVKSNKKEEGKDVPCPIEVEKSRKSARKSVRADSKEKSFHKSRIQQSIKDNLDLQNNSNLIVAEPQNVEQSIKSHTINRKIERQSSKQVGCESKSAQRSVKRESIKEIDPAQSIKPSEKGEPSVKVSRKSGISPSEKNKIQEGKQEEDKKSQYKVSRVTSNKPEGKVGQSKKEESVKDSHYDVHINPVGSIRSSQIEPPSVKQKPIQIPEVSPVNVETQSKKQAEKEEVKSHKTSRYNQDNKSKKSQNLISNEVGSKNNSAAPEETKSRHINIMNIQETKSRKSYLNQQTLSKKSNVGEDSGVKQSRLNNQEITSKKSSVVPPAQDEDLKSKHSSRVSKPEGSERKSSRVRSIKKDISRAGDEEVKSRKSEAVQELKSRKSSSVKKNKEDDETEEKAVIVIDKSVQYSRVTENNQQSHVNEIKFQNISEKNSSIIQPNEESSLNESSNFKLEMLNKELSQEVVQKLEDSNLESYNMKKKKQEPFNENQSEKKSRSFIIHSRNGSVKERTEKNYDKMKKSELSEKKSQRVSEPPSNYPESVSKEEIFKLHEQIAFLREKLKKVEERQIQLEKMEENNSKTSSKHEIQDPNKNESEIRQSPPQIPSSPLVRLSEISLGLKPQGKLHLESSIIQVNTSEEARKKMEKESQVEQKVKLMGEISRLKKIIRDMQIEKIKSIDPDNDSEFSPLLKKDSKNLSHKDSRVERQKESINQIEDMPTQKKFWGKSRIQDVGRIIKNSHVEYEKEEISPRRRSQQIKLYANEEEIMPDELPYQSAQRSPLKFIKGAKHSSMIERLQDKDKDFHHFVESSRILVEDGGKREPTDQEIEVRPGPFQQFSKVSSTGFAQPSNKINYSRMVEQFKKHNPEEEQVLPEIHLRDIKIPQIPNTPTAQMNQEDLLALAKQTYQLFGVDVDNQDKQLCVKKYKNCVVFTLTNNTSECILWHFSGKFYMGGWRSGQPGEGEKNGEGLEIVPEKYAYKGQFLNGKKNGTGILKLVNGNIYDGQWIDGLKNGRGVYLDAATRVVYSGQWREGKKDGQGYLKLSDKEYYYGTFVKSVKEGFGVEIFVNGDKYKGEYKNGKFNGKGKYTWANGSCYEGQFEEGVRQGQGSWKSAKNNGDIYIGTYETDKKNGYGRYVWANGCMYEGGFFNDVKHGKGRLTYQDGKEVKGVWEEGNLVKTENEKQVPGDHQEQPLRRSVKVNSFGGYHPATRTKF